MSPMVRNAVIASMVAAAAAGVFLWTSSIPEKVAHRGIRQAFPGHCGSFDGSPCASHASSGVTLNPIDK